jgi:hypothetical protein
MSVWMNFRSALCSPEWPPQLAASFISNHAHNVSFWHLADKRTQPSNGRYWGNSGQSWILARDGLSVNDPLADMRSLPINAHTDPQETFTGVVMSSSRSKKSAIRT